MEKHRDAWLEFINSLSQLDEFKGDIEELADEFAIIDQMNEEYNLQLTDGQRYSFAWAVKKSNELSEDVANEVMKSLYNALLVKIADAYIGEPRKTAWVAFMLGVVWERYFKPLK